MAVYEGGGVSVNPIQLLGRFIIGKAFGGRGGKQPFPPGWTGPIRGHPTRGRGEAKASPVLSAALVQPDFLPPINFAAPLDSSRLPRVYGQATAIGSTLGSYALRAAPVVLGYGLSAYGNYKKEIERAEKEKKRQQEKDAALAAKIRKTAELQALALKKLMIAVGTRAETRADARAREERASGRLDRAQAERVREFDLNRKDKLLRESLDRSAAEEKVRAEAKAAQDKAVIDAANAAIAANAVILKERQAAAAARLALQIRFGSFLWDSFAKPLLFPTARPRQAATQTILGGNVVRSVPLLVGPAPRRRRKKKKRAKRKRRLTRARKRRVG